MDLDVALFDAVAAFAAQCRAVVAGDGALFASLFTAGLIGSAVHCAGMCGPFVLSQVGARMQAVPAARMTEFHRLSGPALLPYHLGRTTTYVALGALAGGIAGGIAAMGNLRWLSAALLVLAAALFLAYALQRLGVRLPLRGTRPESGTAKTLGRLASPLFRRPVGWRGYGLGVVLGFIPCGLLYGALAAAGASGGMLAGALAMAAFALGTVPALLAIGYLGTWAAGRWHTAATKIAPGLMVVNALVLSFMAWRLVA